MRVCRFMLDDTVLLGFYADERVVPIHQAAEAYCEAAVDATLFFPSSDSLLDLLPPEGSLLRGDARRVPLGRRA